eukprot:13947681-Alexandrium_andersonii.AAC.1
MPPLPGGRARGDAPHDRRRGNLVAPDADGCRHSGPVSSGWNREARDGYPPVPPAAIGPTCSCSWRTGRVAHACPRPPPEPMW